MCVCVCVCMIVLRVRWRMILLWQVQVSIDPVLLMLQVKRLRLTHGARPSPPLASALTFQEASTAARVQLLANWVHLVASAVYSEREADTMVGNWTVGFSDGKLLLALLHHYAPALVRRDEIGQQTTGWLRWHHQCEAQDQMAEINSFVALPADVTPQQQQAARLIDQQNVRLFLKRVTLLGPLPAILTESDLLETIPDEKVVLSYISALSLRLLMFHRENHAARTIQKLWRVYHRRKINAMLCVQEAAITKIQRLVRRYLAVRRKVRAIERARYLASLTQSTVVLQAATRRWSARRQLCCLRRSRDESEFLLEQQSSKLARQAASRAAECTRQEWLTLVCLHVNEQQSLRRRNQVAAISMYLEGQVQHIQEHNAREAQANLAEYAERRTGQISSMQMAVAAQHERVHDWLDAQKLNEKIENDSRISHLKLAKSLMEQARIERLTIASTAPRSSFNTNTLMDIEQARRVADWQVWNSTVHEIQTRERGNARIIAQQAMALALKERLVQWQIMMAPTSTESNTPSSDTRALQAVARAEQVAQYQLDMALIQEQTQLMRQQAIGAALSAWQVAQTERMAWLCQDNEHQASMLAEYRFTCQRDVALAVQREQEERIVRRMEDQHAAAVSAMAVRRASIAAVLEMAECGRRERVLAWQALDTAVADLEQLDRKHGKQIASDLAMQEQSQRMDIERQANLVATRETQRCRQDASRQAMILFNVARQERVSLPTGCQVDCGVIATDTRALQAVARAEQVAQYQLGMALIQEQTQLMRQQAIAEALSAWQVAQTERMAWWRQDNELQASMLAEYRFTCQRDVVLAVQREQDERIVCRMEDQRAEAVSAVAVRRAAIATVIEMAECGRRERVLAWQAMEVAAHCQEQRDQLCGIDLAVALFTEARLEQIQDYCLRTGFVCREIDAWVSPVSASQTAYAKASALQARQEQVASWSEWQQKKAEEEMSLKNERIRVAKQAATLARCEQTARTKASNARVTVEENVARNHNIQNAVKAAIVARQEQIELARAWNQNETEMQKTARGHRVVVAQCAADVARVERVSAFHAADAHVQAYEQALVKRGKQVAMESAATAQVEQIEEYTASAQFNNALEMQAKANAQAFARAAVYAEQAARVLTWKESVAAAQAESQEARQMAIKVALDASRSVQSAAEAETATTHAQMKRETVASRHEAIRIATCLLEQARFERTFSCDEIYVPLQTVTKSPMSAENTHFHQERFQDLPVAAQAFGKTLRLTLRAFLSNKKVDGATIERAAILIQGNVIVFFLNCNFPRNKEKKKCFVGCD